MSTLSDRLRELRGSSSQKEIAEAIGIKWNAWARYERGEVAPGAEILSNICRVNGCSSDWLLGLDKSGSASTVTQNVVIGNSTTNNSAATPGEAPLCKKCPYKDKLKKLEALIK